MKKSLKHYLAEVTRIYEYRLKLACEPTDEQLDAMERHLIKYVVFDVTTPKKTIIQKKPKDFPGIEASEIFIIDFKTYQPVSPHTLRIELTQKMGISERFIFVCDKKDMSKLEDEESEDFNNSKKGYKPRLGDSDYSEFDNPDADKYFGEKFKSQFIKDALKSRKDFTHTVKDD